MNKAGILIILTGFLCMVGYYAKYSKFNSKKIPDNVIIVGTNAEYPPFSYVQDDKIVGFDIDLINEIALRMGKKVTIKDMPFDILIPEINRGSIQLIAAGLTPSPEREKEIHFSKCYFTGDPLVILSLAAAPLSKVSDLRGKKVVVNEGYTADYYMTKVGGSDLIRLPSPAGAFLALDSGRAQAYVAAKSTVTAFLLKNKQEKFIYSSIDETEERYAFAISPTILHLSEELNGLIVELERDGTFNRLKKKWNLV